MGDEAERLHGPTEAAQRRIEELEAECASLRGALLAADAENALLREEVNH